LLTNTHPKYSSPSKPLTFQPTLRGILIPQLSSQGARVLAHFRKTSTVGDPQRMGTVVLLSILSPCLDSAFAFQPAFEIHSLYQRAGFHHTRCHIAFALNSSIWGTVLVQQPHRQDGDRSVPLRHI
jgi:hypothetical protein